jgi:hypothetical protein
MEVKPLTLMDVNLERAEHGLRPLSFLGDRDFPAAKTKRPLTPEAKKRKINSLRKSQKKLNDIMDKEEALLREKAKEANKLRRRRVFSEKLLAHLSDPGNKPPENRLEYMAVLGLTRSRYKTFTKMFSDDDLAEIESQGLELRRRRYANKLAKIDDGLLEKAAEGRAPEAKLAYQRFEGWTEKTVTEVNNNFNVQLDVEIKKLLAPVYKGIIDVEPSGKTGILPESIQSS